MKIIKTLEKKTCHSRSFYYILNKSGIKRIKRKKVEKNYLWFKGNSVISLLNEDLLLLWLKFMFHFFSGMLVCHYPRLLTYWSIPVGWKWFLISTGLFGKLAVLSKNKIKTKPNQTPLLWKISWLNIRQKLEIYKFQPSHIPLTPNYPSSIISFLTLIHVIILNHLTTPNKKYYNDLKICICILQRNMIN